MGGRRASEADIGQSLESSPPFYPKRVSRGLNYSDTDTRDSGAERDSEGEADTADHSSSLFPENRARLKES